MRDLIVSLILVALMPACYRRPFVGLSVFSWLAYMRVQDLTWGFARYQRWSYYVAILMISGYLLARHKKRIVGDVRLWALAGLVVLVGIGFAISENPNQHQFKRYMEFVKIIGIAFFTAAVVTDKERLRVLVWIIALSLGFYGVKVGLWGILTGGSAQVLQGPGGMLADNNDFSLALSMAVPMLFILGWTERKPELKKAFWFCLPLTVMAVGLTHSRGGFLACSVAIAVLIWRSRNRLQAVFVGMLVAGAAVFLMPAEYKERLKTLRNPSEESSAAGRLRAWGIATRMATANPWFGVGFGKFRQHYLQFTPDPTPKELAGTAVIVAHSSYFQIWAECGTPAMVLYFFLIFYSFWTCWKVRRMARARYFSSWIINYATMFEASLAAFAVGATFLNRAHFDLFYHWVALIMVFGHLAVREMKDEKLHPVRPGGRGAIRRIQPTGFGPRARRSGFAPRVAQGSV